MIPSNFNPGAPSLWHVALPPSSRASCLGAFPRVRFVLERDAGVNLYLVVGAGEIGPAPEAWALEIEGLLGALPVLDTNGGGDLIVVRLGELSPSLRELGIVGGVRLVFGETIV